MNSSPPDGNNLPEKIPASGTSSQNGEQRRVLEAEVLNPGQGHDQEQGQKYGRGSGQSHEQGHNGHGRSSFGGATFQGGFHVGGLRFGTLGARGAQGNACLAPCISLALFLVCLAQFGLLAGIGFMFFLLVGSAAGAMRDMRQMMQGRVPNPWLWRIGNWLACFLLTAWLAGGFD